MRNFEGSILLKMTEVDTVLQDLRQSIIKDGLPRSWNHFHVLITSTVKQLLSVTELPINPKKKYYVKFIGHMLNLSGYTSEASIEKSIRQSKELNFEDLYGLEFWNQSDFLALHVYSLLVVMARAFNRASIDAQMQGLLSQEILYAVNAYQVFHHITTLFSMDLEDGMQDEKKIVVFMKSFVQELMDKRADLAMTLIFPCGYQEHAMYLSMIWIGDNAEQLLLRMDNVGEGTERK